MINCLPQAPPQSVFDGKDNLNTGIIQSCVKSLVGRAVLFENSNNSDDLDLMKETITNNNNNNSIGQQQLHQIKKYASSDESSYNNINYIRDQFQKKSDCFLIGSTEDENKAYDEIDRLYEYVRTGILPDAYTTFVNNNTTTNNNTKSNLVLKLPVEAVVAPPLAPLNQPIKIKITNDNLKRQQSTPHLVVNNHSKSKEDIKLISNKTKKKDYNNNNNSNDSINKTEKNNNNNKELLDYYYDNKLNQIKRSASLNKLDSINQSNPNSQSINNNNNNKSVNQSNNQTKKKVIPKLVFPIVKQNKKVNFSNVNHVNQYPNQQQQQQQQQQQVLPPPPVISKNSKSIKPIELKLSDLTELANIKAIVAANHEIVKPSVINKLNKNVVNKSTVYNKSIITKNNQSTIINQRNNLRKNEFYDSLQTLNDYDFSSSNNLINSSRKKNNLYNSFAANELMSSQSDLFEEESENFFQQKSQFAPFNNNNNNAKSNLDMSNIYTNDKILDITKKKVKTYANNNSTNNQRHHHHHPPHKSNNFNTRKQFI